MKTILAVLVAGLVSTAVWADVESGPKAGEKVPVLKAFGVAGSVTEKETDFAKDRGEGTDRVRVRQAEHFAGRPPASCENPRRENRRTRRRGQGGGRFGLRLRNVEKNKEYLPKVQKSMKFGKSDLAVFTGDKSGPDNWGINPDAHGTVAAAHWAKRGQVPLPTRRSTKRT